MSDAPGNIRSTSGSSSRSLVSGALVLKTWMARRFVPSTSEANGIGKVAQAPLSTSSRRPVDTEFHEGAAGARLEATSVPFNHATNPSSKRIRNRNSDAATTLVALNKNRENRARALPGMRLRGFELVPNHGEKLIGDAVSSHPRPLVPLLHPVAA